jgi:hypothetical protein
MKEQLKRSLSYLLDLKAVLFGFTLFNFVWMWVRESRIQWQWLDYDYFENTHRVFLLLLASAGLLLKRWWSFLLTMLLGGWVLNDLVFRPLQAASLAHGVAPLSWFSLRNWWVLMYEFQPQYIIHIGIAAVIFIYAALLLWKWVYSRATESNNSLDRTRN